VTFAVLGMLNWSAGTVMAVSSLAGILLGIWLMNKVHLRHYKQTLIVFYIIIFSLTAYKLILE
jgi:uncharacterized membrane protein YfcA